MTPITVLGVAVLTVLGKYGVALGLGIVVGAMLFVRGASVGGRLGNAQLISHSRAAVSMRLGACLALAGIAAGAQGYDPPWAWPARAALGLGQLIASILAIGLAAWQAKQTRIAKENQGSDETTARQL